MSPIDFKFQGPYGWLRGAYGPMKGTAISNALWYSAEDLSRALGYVDDYYLQKTVSRQNLASRVQIDRTMGQCRSEVYVNNAGVNEFLNITSSSRRGKIKEWFDGLIVPRSESLVKQLEELSKDYRDVSFSVDAK